MFGVDKVLNSGKILIGLKETNSKSTFTSKTKITILAFFKADFAFSIPSNSIRSFEKKFKPAVSTNIVF